MLRIKDWNTAYWGYIRTAVDPYPCSNKVNAYIGPSGGGKTTLMDAIRIGLGDAKFENNRSMEHYIHPRSNWAVVRISFWNGPDESQPFYPMGYKEEVVTVCVRLDKSSGKCERDYYIFGGNFQDILDLGQNPKLYKARIIGYKEYLKLLEEAGITKAFRRLMMMRPEDIQNTVDLQPNQLFDRVFELKRQKEIQDTHDETQKKVREIINQEETTLQDLATAEEKLGEYEEKKKLYEENKLKKEEHSKLNSLLMKRRFYDSKYDLNNQIEGQNKTENERDQLLETKEIHIDKLWNTNQEIKQIDTQRDKVNSELRSTETKKTEKNSTVVTLTTQLEIKNEEIDRLNNIPEESIEDLNKEYNLFKHKYEEVKFNCTSLEKESKRLTEQLNDLFDGKYLFPDWVSRYRGALGKINIPYIMLGDCISVKKEYEPWLEAIEALLGRERFRIIAEDEYQLEAKKLQEQFKFGARLSRKKGSRQQINNNLLMGKFPSVRYVLDLENDEMIGGYLDRFNNIYLVNSVEEGHNAQREGYTTITKKGLLQDDDGALFLEARELVCGRFAREKYRDKIRESLENIDRMLKPSLDELKFCEEKVTEIVNRIRLQKDREKLPELMKENENLNESIIEAKHNLDQVENEYKRLLLLHDEIWQKSLELTRVNTEYESSWNNLLQKISEVEASLNGYKGNIAKCRQALESAEANLRKNGYDEHDIEFIDVEVKQEKIFIKKDSTEWTKEILESKVSELEEELKIFKITYKDINESIVAMIEPQKIQVIRLKGELEKARSDREDWQERLENAELELRNHVRETMNQYIEEFCNMAQKLGAKASGRFIQDGESYSQWYLQIKIGFDGKELKPYFDPAFSKGQRAAISIMLLLSAINNNREGSRNTIMFLDEPTSRVDDYRASEIGHVLQSTNIQYFITHQVSASLQSVEWIDYGYVISKIRDGEEFADDPIFESRRII